jgi:hypothetical protein
LQEALLGIYGSPYTIPSTLHPILTLLKCFGMSACSIGLGGSNCNSFSHERLSNIHGRFVLKDDQQAMLRMYMRDGRIVSGAMHHVIKLEVQASRALVS